MGRRGRLTKKFSRDLVDQLKSNDLKPVGRPDVNLVDIRRCQTFTAALNLCIALSGEKNDKPVREDLGIDAGTWSRIKAGQNSYPQDRYDELFERCRNEVLREPGAVKRALGAWLRANRERVDRDRAHPEYRTLVELFDEQLAQVERVA